jgi:hypothetical protein
MAHVEIEHIVREVMRRLRDGTTAAPAPSTSGASEHGPTKAGPGGDGSSGAASSDDGRTDPARPALCAAPRAEPEFRQRVISLATLKGRLDGSRCVRIPRGAVVTPSAHDELRRRGIRIQYLPTAGERAAAATTELLVGTWHPSHCPRSFLEAMRAGGQQVTRVELSDSPLPMTRLLDQLDTGSNRLGVLLTDKPSLALCLTNRPPRVRAAWGLDPRSIAEAVSSLAANLLIVEPARHTLSEMVNLTRTFQRTAGASCPQQLKQLMTTENEARP